TGRGRLGFLRPRLPRVRVPAAEAGPVPGRVPLRGPGARPADARPGTAAPRYRLFPPPPGAENPRRCAGPGPPRSNRRQTRRVRGAVEQRSLLNQGVRGPQMTTDLSTLTDEEALCRCLGATLPAALGRPCAVTAVRGRCFDLATSYRAKVVDVHLDTGAE